MKPALLVSLALAVAACGAKEAPSPEGVTPAPPPSAASVVASAEPPAAPIAGPKAPAAVLPAIPAARVVVAAPVVHAPAASAEKVRRVPLVTPGLLPASPVAPSPVMFTSPQGNDGPSMTSFRSTGGQVTPGDFSPRPLQVAPTGNQLTNLTTSPSFGGTPRSF